MSDEFNEMAQASDFDPSEMSEEVAEEAHKQVSKEGRGEPLGRPEEYDDEDPGDPMDEKPEPRPPARTYKAKANGRDIEVPAEALDSLASAFGVAPEDLLRGPQMLKAGQQRLREAAEKEKSAQIIGRAIREGATGELTKDTRRALKEAGIHDEDLHNFAIKRVNELMEIERLQRENPAELERRKTAAELEELQSRKQQEEQSILQSRAEERLSREISAVLETNKLPKDPYYVRRLAAHMNEQLERGADADDLHAADFVPLVLEEIQTEHGKFIEGLPGEELIARYPKMAEKVRKAFAAKVRRDGPPSRQPEGSGDREVERAPKQRVRASTSEVLRRWRENG